MFGIILASGVAGWLAWRVNHVRKVRYARLNAMLAKYGHLVNDLDSMSYKDARDIMTLTHFWDMPFSMTLSLSLALFNTYAIPSISSVLSSTGELSEPATAARRAEDTAVYVSEFLTQGLDSERGSRALARMNWLHGRWGSRIKQGDLLYTLSLFIFEPITFAAKYEWRPLSELEAEARFVYWGEIGARMGIKDIPTTRQALWNWKEQYATINMKYAKSNDKVGQLTMDILVAPAPSFLKNIGKEAGKVFVEPRVLEAFGWSAAEPRVLCTLVTAAMRLRAFVTANLFYPRSQMPGYFVTTEVPIVSEDGTEEAKIQREGFIFQPWYVPAGRSRIGSLGIAVPGQEEQWQSSGWMSDSLGPDRLRMQGRGSVRAEGERLRQEAKMCPFFR